MTHPRLTRLTLATASSVLLVATLAACGSGDGQAGAASGANAESNAGAGGGTPPGGRASGMMPGASGTVAAVSGRTAQVQGQQSGQVAVTWTGTTTFTQQVGAKLADVKVGSCVVAMGASDGAAATSVRVTAATDDGCSPGGPGGGQGGGPGGERPSGAPTDMPSGAPTDMPSTMPSGGPGAGGFGAFGEVTAVSASGFTVSTQDGQTTDVTVDGSTTYSTTAKAAATDVKVGRCLTARGDADDTGAVTATSVSLSDPVDGQCGFGFGGGMGRPGGASA